MPTKQEIAANKSEARDLTKTLKSTERSSLAASKAQRAIIKKAERELKSIESERSALAQKINRRLAILEGRNEA